MNNTAHDLAYDLARHPALPGIHQPHRYGKEGGENPIFQVDVRALVRKVWLK